jgi:hypothetical protein
MARIGFVTLRVLVAIAALASLIATGLIMLVIAFFNIMKGLLSGVGGMIVTFASAFQKSPETPNPDPGIPWPLFGLAILFGAMFASVFLPGQRIFLHVVAGMALIAEAWEIWRIATIPNYTMLYTPVMVLWVVYYVVCLRRA